jgi:hypothetical protein
MNASFMSKYLNYQYLLEDHCRIIFMIHESVAHT